jgi:hypothetical protein
MLFDYLNSPKSKTAIIAAILKCRTYPPQSTSVMPSLR